MQGDDHQMVQVQMNASRSIFSHIQGVARSAIVAMSLITLAGCQSLGLSLPGTDADSKPPAANANIAPQLPVQANVIGTGRVRVGLILPLTGEGAGGVAGNALRNAAELAMAEFQNPDIQLLVKDDRGTPDGAREAAQAAVAEGAELIIGPLFAGSVQAAGQVARAANRPVIAFSTDASVASRGVYLLSFMAESEVDRIVDFASAQGKRSYAALIPDTAYGRVVEGAFQQAVARKGGRVVAIERYTADRSRISEAVGRVAKVASGASPQADVLFMPEAGDNLPALAQAVQAAGINTSRVKPIGTGVWNDSRVFRVAGLNNGWFAAPDTGGFNAFAGRYRARFNADPTRIATLAYDSVSLAAALVRTQGTQRFSEQVLTTPTGFAGADGVFRFRADGVNERGLAVLEIRNGAATTISAAPRSLGSGT
jgi:ABC-type branched-subunit amino acid transport system substrate-binding protein